MELHGFRSFFIWSSHSVITTLLWRHSSVFDNQTYKKNIFRGKSIKKKNQLECIRADVTLCKYVQKSSLVSGYMRIRKERPCFDFFILFSADIQKIFEFFPVWNNACLVSNSENISRKSRNFPEQWWFYRPFVVFTFSRNRRTIPAYFYFISILGYFF